MNSKKSLSVKLFLLISLFCFAFASLMLVLPNNTVETAYAAAVGYKATYDGSAYSWDPSQPSVINAGDAFTITSTANNIEANCIWENYNYYPSKLSPLIIDAEHKYSVGVQGDTITLTRLSYSVAYDGNGATSGSVPASSTEYEQNDSVTVLGNTGSLEYTDYAFVGWNTKADGTGTDYAANASFSMPATDITLYAQWGVKTTIELDTTPQRFAYTGNAVDINLIDNVTKEATEITGFNIAYSQKNNDGSTYTSVTSAITPGSYKATITRAEDATYFEYSQDIIFYISYSVTYKANGGTGADYVDISSGTEYYADSSIGSNIGNAYPKTTGITPFTKEGYTFDTWNTKADGTGTAYDTNAGFIEYLTENISIYACYSANIKTQPTSSNDYSVEIDTTDEVTYQWYKCNYATSSTPGKLVAGNENGGVITSSSKTIAFGCGKFDAIQFETTATLKEGVRGVDGSYIYLITKFGMKGCAIEITSDEEFTISNIQWLTVSDVEVTGETSSKLTNADENTYYYCSIKSKYNAITNSQRVTTSAAIFKGNSATGGTAPQTLFGLKGGKITIPSNTFEKTGYDFIGWNTDSSATSGLSFTDNKYTMGDSNVTFYAIWGHKHGNSGDPGYMEFSLPITYDYLNGLTNNGDGNTELTSGNYFLTANTTLDSNIKNLIIPSGQTVNICLNGYTLDLDGYYIQNNGTLTIYDCQNAGKIKGDKANKQGYYSAELNYQGGAIYNNAGTLTINGGTFTENYADQGGAIYNNNGAITINAGTFDQNIAYISGGAIYNNLGTLTINGGTFTNDSASGSKHTYGGAIYIAGGTVNISGATFGGASGKGNLSHTGGAIYNLGTLTIGNNTIISYNGGAEDGETKTGGAIFNDGTLTISGGAISYNSSIFVGGAISNSGNGTLTISGGTISNNTSEDGGAICNDGTLIIIGGTISNNSATNSSGGIYNEYVKDGNDVQIRGTITVGGSAIISGNTVNSKANNVYLVDNTSLTVGVDANVPTSTMSVGITLESGSGTFVTGDTTNNKNYFTSDNSIYVVSVAEVAGSPKTYSYSLEQKYSVSYDDNTDDTVTNMPTQDDNLYLSGEKVTIPSNIPVRTGYKFLGWNIDKDATVALTFTDGKYTIETSNVTFYAIWEDKYYSKNFKVTFPTITEYTKAEDIEISTDHDDELTLESVHILQPLATGGVEYINSISKPGEYMVLVVLTAKDGIAFKKGTYGYVIGYLSCTGGECGGTMVASAYDFTKTFDQEGFATPGATDDDDIKLLIILGVIVEGGNTISFNANTTDTITGLPEDETYLKGTPISIPTPSTREGYNFLGWNTDKDATVALTFTDGKYTIETSNVTFYAIWESLEYNKEFSVTITPTLKYGVKDSDITIAASDSDLKIFDWRMYLYDMIEKTCTPKTSIDVPGYYVFMIIVEGKTENYWFANVADLYKKAVTILNASEVYAYAITSYDFSAPTFDISPTHSTKLGLEVLLNIPSYTVTYDDNVESEEIIVPEDESTYIEGEPVTISTTTPIRTGYKFLGWNTDKDATVALTFENNKYTMGNSNVTFYAIWTDKTVVSITETEQTYTYNGASQGFEIKGTHKDIGSFVVKYYVDDAWTTTVPINAGSYDVKITRAEDDTYVAYEKEIEDGLTINKFNVTVSIDKTSFVYNGEDQQSGLKATYKDVNDQVIALTLDYVTPKDFNSLGFINAGVYIASFVFAQTEAESTNYSLGEYEDYEAEVVIDKKEIVIDWCEDDFTYNGSEQVITATYKDVKDDSIELGVGYSAQFKDAGKYTATVLFKNSEANYKLPSTITNEFTMKKQKVNEPTIKSTYIYAGQPIVPEFNGVLDCMVIKEGATAQNEPGFYKTEFSLDSNHAWADGSDGFVDWKILKQEDEYVEPEKEESQVKVEYKEGFDPNISLQVKVTEKEEIPKTELSVDYNNLQNEEIKLKANEVVGVVFDVKLIKTVDGVDSIIQPSDIKAGATITVKFLIPEYVNVDKIARILHVHSSENIESLLFNESSYDPASRYYTMETDSFSEFAFIYIEDPVVEPVKGSKDLTPAAIAGISIGTIIGFILILFITLFIIWKNEYDDEQKYIEENKKANVDIELEVKSKYTRKLKFLDPVYRPINKALFGKKEA